MITSLRLCLSAAAIVAASTFAVADEQPATGTPAATPTTSQPATPATTPASTDEEKTICKRQQVTGTRLGNYKICMTQKEWDEMARTSAQDTARFQRQGDAERPGPKGAGR